MFKLAKHPVTLYIFTNILLFFLLFFYHEPRDYSILIAGALVLFLSIITYTLFIYLNWGDRYLFIIASMLVVLGIAMLYRLDSAVGQKQIIWYLIGIFLFTISYLVYRYLNFWSKLKWFYLVVSILLFISTLIFGTNINGAKNWIKISTFTFQPSEFIKILFLFFLACYFTNKEKPLKIGILNNKYIHMCIVLTFLLFLIIQREWGITLLFFFTYILLFYIYENDWIALGVTFFMSAIIGVVGYYTMYHIRIRVFNWIDPWRDVANKGYQITQSLFAIASGNFFGTGIGLGSPELIPAVHSDFIFSAICEEMGIFGGIAVIMLFFVLVYRGVKISLSLESFDKCIAVGITIMLGLQTFIIIGGVIKLIPLTGITLPFISYGGSSLLASFISLGILQAISAKGGVNNGN